MKAVLFCVCAFVLCVFAVGQQTFTPAELPCAAKIFYTEVFDLYEPDKNTTRFFSGYLAFYGRYMTQHEIEKAIDSDIYVTVRVDMPDSKDPQTAALVVGFDFGTPLCNLSRYNSYDDLYFGMGFERGYFLDEFAYNTSESATFKGEDCTAYIFEVDNQKKTWYVNSENRTIGYMFENATMHRVWDAIYQLYAQNIDFRMPTKFPGCPDKAYQNLAPEPKCDLYPDSSSAASSGSAPHSSGSRSSSSSSASSLEVAVIPLFLAIAACIMAVL